MTSPTPRRPKGSGSITRIADNRFRLRTRVKDPVTSSWRPVTAIFHGTPVEAELALHRFMTRIHGTDHHGTTATVATLLDRWLEHIKTRVEWSTWSRRETIVRLHLLPDLGAVPLVDLTPSHLDALYDRLLTRPMDPATVRKIHDVIRQALRQAQRWGWRLDNPAEMASPPTTHRKPPVSADPDDLIRFVKYLNIRAPDIGMFVDILADLGCRPGELCAVRWCDVDLPAAQLTISGSIARDPGTPRRKSTKTHRDRRVALSAGSVIRLRQHQARSSIITPLAYVFSDVADHSVAWQPMNVSARIQHLRKGAGLTTALTMRSLRHFVATNLIGAGVDVRTVAGRLGHVNPAMTLNVYASFLPENDRAAAELLAEIRKRQQL